MPGRARCAWGPARTTQGIDMTDDQPFYLIVTDHDRSVYAVEGPMTDDRPWNEAATALAATLEAEATTR
jgi:hypothetical protein